ncbi:MAG: hypothetical protein K9K82_09190 [Desulfobacteraceae bacterium]|nr:hypothetical protein [Desulfobacteraceae bacterium]
MKQYVIDELRDSDTEKLQNLLTDRFGRAMLDRVYWVPLDRQYYTTVQAAHEDCHPLYFALQVKPGALVGEFLVRTHNRVRCECMGYATEAQQRWFISVIDGIINELDIAV